MAATVGRLSHGPTTASACTQSIVALLAAINVALAWDLQRHTACKNMGAGVHCCTACCHGTKDFLSPAGNTHFSPDAFRYTEHAGLLKADEPCRSMRRLSSFKIDQRIPS